MDTDVIELSGCADTITGNSIIIVGKVRRYLCLAEISWGVFTQADEIGKATIGFLTFTVLSLRILVHLVINHTIEHLGKLRSTDQLRPHRLNSVLEQGRYTVVHLIIVICRSHEFTPMYLLKRYCKLI